MAGVGLVRICIYLVGLVHLPSLFHSECRGLKPQHSHQVQCSGGELSSSTVWHVQGHKNSLPPGWWPCSRSFALLSLWACSSATVAHEPNAGILYCTLNLLGQGPYFTVQILQSLTGQLQISCPLPWLVDWWLPAWSSNWEWNVAFCLDKLWQGANRSYLWNTFIWKLKNLRQFPSQFLQGQSWYYFQVGKAAPSWPNVNILWGASRY